MDNPVRHDWQLDEVSQYFELPFFELIYQAHCVHRAHFNPQEVQMSRLLSIKTGGCPEDCKYCGQSSRYNTGVQRENLLSVEAVIEKAKEAKEGGASRFCMGAAWRNPQGKAFQRVLEMIKAVKAMGMETCVTLGMLSTEQVQQLEEAGLDYYNHNLDSSPEFYKRFATTRTYQDRLDTLHKICDSNINACCGGIIGMGESREDRMNLLIQVANLPKHPPSVPINLLIKVKGTPMDDLEEFEPFEFIRTIAVARIMLPKSVVRLTAGRTQMNEQTQAWCFFAGANSVHLGDKNLVTPLPGDKKDNALWEKLQIKPFIPVIPENVL